MYDIIKNVINRGDFNLSKVMEKVNTLWLEDVLADEQRDELIDLARNNAKPENNLLEKIAELEARICTLEEDNPSNITPMEV